MVKDCASDHVFRVFSAAFLGLIMLLTIYPMYFVLIASISDASLVALGKVTFWPKGFQLDAYRRVFANANIWRAYKNTLIYTSVGTLINVSCTMTAAFVFSRSGLKGRRVCMLLILFTMYFGGGLIPTYFNIRSLGMLNTMWALVIPGAIGSYNMIVARTYIQANIPDALSEAATIDGCSHIRFYVKIVLPLSTPIIGVLALYCVVGHWNSYYSPLIYLTRRSDYPLQLILREILVQSKVTMEDLSTEDMESSVRFQEMAEALKYALIIVSSVPMLILYPFLQRFFVKGVMVGSLKG